MTSGIKQIKSYLYLEMRIQLLICRRPLFFYDSFPFPLLSGSSFSCVSYPLSYSILMPFSAVFLRVGIHFERQPEWGTFQRLLPLEQVKFFTVWDAGPKLTHCTSWWIPGGYFILLFLDTTLLSIASSCIVADSIQVLWLLVDCPHSLVFFISWGHLVF